MGLILVLRSIERMLTMHSLWYVSLRSSQYEDMAKRLNPAISRIPACDSTAHKVLIYIEHHRVCPLVVIGTPPPL